MFLIIEDSAEDAALIRRAFAQIDHSTAFVCRNVSEAKAYVAGAGMYSDRGRFPVPQAVICDLRLGGESGLDFLAWLKGKPKFGRIPVAILSGTASEKEMLAAKTEGAASVLRKPENLEELRALLADFSATTE